MGLRGDLLSVVLTDLPTPTSTLGENSNPDRWDELLGGRTGPNSWGRYGRGSGTTCLIVLDGWAISAGFPDDMIVNVPTPNGGGTKIAQALINGAKSRGWYVTPVRGQLPDLRPGDIYSTNHVTNTGVDGTHVGVVTSVEVSDDGQSMTIGTADGGQGPLNAQEATRTTRTITLGDGPHPWLVRSPLSSGWLQWAIHVGGDVPDPAADGSGGEPGSDEAPSTLPTGGTIVAAGLVAAGVLAFGIGLRYLSGGPPHIAAVTSPGHGTWAVARRLRERELRR